MIGKFRNVNWARVHATSTVQQNSRRWTLSLPSLLKMQYRCCNWTFDARTGLWSCYSKQERRLSQRVNRACYGSNFCSYLEALTIRDALSWLKGLQFDSGN
ncbi:hypothetical protein E1A91_D09G210400v1 [Gossypium mustelinum]|uniref:Uncharacterized protein n=1 Tax=Gossypium mustelinum TaxID=34275 RepID=A0A5D2TPP8_GOSMU|nr:hypothetical protein E1A91_D09G210400v1 [Gossypium mustelinum]TYI66243.1 hypothetical protein E1A91_D09G210400v1 [Gossypium mustelinum]